MLNATYFIRRVADNRYGFTSAIYATSAGPTVLEMLTYEKLKEVVIAPNTNPRWDEHQQIVARQIVSQCITAKRTLSPHAAFITVMYQSNMACCA